MQKIKQEDLVLYLYREASFELTLAIEKALEESWELQEELKILERTIQQLNSINLRSPRPQTIEAIISYAQTADEVTH